MSRTLTAAVDTGVAQPNVSDLLMAYMDFTSGIVRVTTLTYDISYGGFTWKGGGAVGSVEPVQESADQQAHELLLKLSGVQTDTISTALGEHYQGREGRLYWAMMDANHQIVPDPVLLFQGRLDTMDLELTSQAVISLRVQSRLADWNRARVRRYNDADQQKAHPGDKFCQYVEQMVSVQLIWGQAGSSPSPLVSPPIDSGWYGGT